MTPNTEVIVGTQNWSDGQSASGAVWNQPEQDQPEQEQLQKDQEGPELPVGDQADSLMVQWPWVLLGFLLTLIIAFIVRDRLLHARLNRFLAQTTDASVDSRQAVSALFAYAVLIARTCGGVHIANAPYVSQSGVIQEAGLCDAATFERAAEANNRALFSTGGIVEADMRSVSDCITELHQGLRAHVPAHRRFWQRHARCLW